MNGFDEGNNNTGVSFNQMIEAYLKRIRIFIEDSDWRKVDEYCEKILDLDAEDGRAYLLKLQAAAKISKIEDFKNKRIPPDKFAEYKNAVRFLDPHNSRLLEQMNREIHESLDGEEKDIRFALGLGSDPEKEEIINRQIEEENRRHEASEAELRRVIDSETERISDALSQLQYNRESRLGIDNRQYQEASGKIISYLRQLNEMHSGLGQFEIKQKKELSMEIDRWAAKLKAMRADHENISAKITKDFEEEEAALKRGVFEAERQLDEETKLHFSRLRKIKNQFSFGRYFIETDEEGIEWIPVKEFEGYILLISRYSIDYMAMDERSGPQSWENCTLRKWLNSEFLHKAFSTDEQTKLVPVKIGDDNYHTVAGDGSSADKVFLLTDAEAKNYFSGNEDLVSTATEYAYAVFNNSEQSADRAAVCDDMKRTMWWLSLSSNNSAFCSFVRCVGDVNSYGYGLNRKLFVRPAVMVKLNSQTINASKNACPKCGTPVDHDDMFCPECGSAIR